MSYEFDREPDPRCDTCRYSKDHAPGEPEKKLRCHRLPQRDSSGWVPVADDDWCALWQPQKKFPKPKVEEPEEEAGVRTSSPPRVYVDMEYKPLPSVPLSPPAFIPTFIPSDSAIRAQQAFLDTSIENAFKNNRLVRQHALKINIPPAEYGREPTIRDLIRYSAEDLLNIRNVGSTCVTEVVHILREYGLVLSNVDRGHPGCAPRKESQ